MDPIKEGNKIFKRLAEEFDCAAITDAGEIEQFFAQLIEKTNGLVIVDFLDTTNWDQIESFEIDKKSRLLTLTWHNFREAEETREHREVREMVFPASVYALGISINSITPICHGEMAAFFINGFAKTKKDIIKIYKPNSSDMQVLEDDLFLKRVVRKIENRYEIVDFHCTPIFSIAILPKNISATSGDSKIMLYQHNLLEALKRLETTRRYLDDLNENDHDAICEKANTTRRILESVLKIECCYKNIEIKDGYSTLLGPMISQLKKTKEEEMQTVLSMFPQILNEFSHDSGKEADLDKARAACALATLYTHLFLNETKSKIMRHPVTQKAD